MFELDDAIFAIRDHKGDKRHTDLIEVVYDNNIDALKSYLDTPEYSTILESESFEYFTPLAVSVSRGHKEMTEILCAYTKPDFKVLKALFQSGQDISYIINAIDYMSSQLDHDAFCEILDDDFLKKRLVLINSPELLEHLVKKYQLNFLLDDGSSMLFIAYNQLETIEEHAVIAGPRGRPYQKTIDYIEGTGFKLSESEQFQLRVIMLLNQKDIKQITQELKHANAEMFLKKNIYTTELIFSKLLSTFTHEQSSEALQLIIPVINPSTYISYLAYLSIKKSSHDEKDIFQKAIFLTQAYKSNLKESDVDISYSINKFFSHVLGLKGEVPAKFGDYLESLEGGSIDNSLINMIYMLKKFEQEASNDKYQPHLKEVTQAVCEAFCVISTDDKELHTAIYTRSLENKEVVIIPARSTKHVFGITLIKKDEDTYYVSLSNRGLGTTFNGSLVYAINQSMAHQIIQTFTSFFESEDRTQEQCNGIFFNIIGHDNQAIKQLPANPQKYGTCAFVNSKRCIETALYLIGLRDLNEDLKSKAHQLYKTFSEFTRDKGIELLCSKLKHNPTSKTLQQLGTIYVTLHYPQQKSKHRIRQVLEVLPSDTAKTLEQAIDNHQLHDKYLLLQSIDQIKIAETALKICQLKGVIDHVQGIQVESHRIKINTVSSREKKYEVLNMFESIAKSPAASQTMFQPHPIENVNGKYEFYFKFQKPEYLASLLMQVERSTAEPSTQQKPEP